METFNGNQQGSVMNKNDLNMMQKMGGFEIKPIDGGIGILGNQLKKIDLSEEQKIQLSSLLQYIPSAMSSSALAQAYTIKFPRGLPHTLMRLKSGGFATPIIDTNKNIVGMASLSSAAPQTAVLGIFTVLSAITGQFFLSLINKELHQINQKIDKIIEFLYGEKKAELLSEISFTKYAYENYSSIMSHEEQRVATISGLQQSKKIAMKDIEFYMNDLDRTSRPQDKKDAEIIYDAGQSLKIRKCLDLSIQLYLSSGLTELHYAQNYDKKYLNYIDHEMREYIDKCKSQMLSSFSMMLTSLTKCNPGNAGLKSKKFDRIKDIEHIVDTLKNQGSAPLCKFLESSLREINQSREYYLINNGEIELYAKSAQR